MIFPRFSQKNSIALPDAPVPCALTHPCYTQFMPTDGSALATKDDIRLLMEEIGKLYAANERWKGELEEQIAVSETRMKDHFDLVAENIRHDFNGAFGDKIEQHEDRLVRLERHAGLRSA